MLKKNILRIIRAPKSLCIRILIKYGKSINDKSYLKILYFLKTNKILNLSNPQTYNEKLQWLKLYNQHPEYTSLVDKITVKNYVSNIIGEKYIIPTIGVWEKFDDIDFSTLPNQFVLKCNHDSGGLVICKNKQKLNIQQAKIKINKSLKRNFFYICREYPYKNVHPKILAESYLTDKSNELKDYKIFCFNGIPQFIEVDFDRFSNHKRNLYSTDWTLQNFEIEYPSDKYKNIEKPKCLKEMLNIAEKLSQGIPHVRVDLYVINDNIYFGEMTFFHGGGFEHFKPEIWNKKFGDLLKLPAK